MLISSTSHQRSALVLSMLTFVLALLAPVSAEQRVFHDIIKREVTVEYPPERIVSLTPSVTEMLFAIGLDQEIVGVTRYCDYPPEAQAREKIGGYYDPSLEKIVALDPHLIVLAADGYNKPSVDRLIEIGMPCFVVDPKSIPEIIDTLRLLAKVTGHEAGAKPRIQALEDRWKAVNDAVDAIPKAEYKRLFYALGPRELWTTGRGTFLHDLIRRAGAINIAADERKGWYQFSAEKLIIADPDFILTGHGAGQTLKDVQEEWQVRDAVPAVAAGRICAVDNDSLSRPGPRLMGVLEELLFQIHGVDLRPQSSDSHAIE